MFSMHNTILLALIAGLFTWGVTAAGASMVFFFKRLNERVTNLMLGFAAGVMIAASFWSLLAPAIEMSASMGRLQFVPALIGFLAGSGFLILLDRLIPHLHIGAPDSEREGLGHRTAPAAPADRYMLLTLAITIHNIPEGLAVGVAFGSAVSGDTRMLTAAVVLAVGIGIQNFPEGAAVSIPLRAGGLSRGRSFFFGQLSAVVEPVFAVIGAALVTVAEPILPFALAFAAGAMIFVVVEELIPESQRGNGNDFSAVGAIAGFCVMMTLDVALG